MIDYLGMVKEFHEKYGHFSLDRPDIYYPENIISLRSMLIQEEQLEFDGALYKDLPGSTGLMRVDTVELADAIADLLYVVFGAAIAFGIPIEEVFKEVHRSNMTKSMKKDEKSIPGKTIKGPDFSPAQIKPIIDRAMGVY